MDGKVIGKQNYRRREAECDGRIHVGGKAELGVSIHTGAHLFENGDGFSTFDWEESGEDVLPELAKF